MVQSAVVCTQVPPFLIVRLHGLHRYKVDASETFLPNLIHSVYTTHLPVLLPHRLGLFLMILAIGSVVDMKQGPDRKNAEKYHYLARAALCEVPVMDDTSFDAVNALVSVHQTVPMDSDSHEANPAMQFFMEWYLLMFSDHKRAAEYAWGIMVSIASALWPRSNWLRRPRVLRRSLRIQ